MNINRLFPRLSIRWKLAIAFALLALVPLIAGAVVATQVAVQRLREFATTSLTHDLELAQRRVEQSLQNVERDVAYLAHTTLAPLLDQTASDDWDAAVASVEAFLRFTPALFQVKAIDANGELLVTVREGTSSPRPSDADAGGMYYALRAESLAPGQGLLLPVELSGDRLAVGAVTTVPAVAILLPVRTAGGKFLGVVVGEAYASVLFFGLEEGSPQLQGVTGLVGSDGLFLYHSAYKRDWARLLAARSDIDLRHDLSESVAQEILSLRAGTLTVSDSRIVSFVPLHLSEGLEPLVLYRAVPLAVLQAPVNRFLLSVMAGGLIVLLLVLGLAVVAAHQFTRPIYQLREAARGLAAGDASVSVEITTNDELEDLAGEFSAMADALTRHRQGLEHLVTKRTQALQEAHAELAGILEHSADAIVGLDHEGHIRVWNAGATSLFGYAATEAVGQEWTSVLPIPGGDPNGEEAFIRRELAERGAVVNLQTKRVPKDGLPFPVSLTQSAIRDRDGRPLGSSLIFRDTRAQAKLESHMRRSDRLAAVSLMAAGLAHELNNPLGIVGNRIEIMQQEVRERCPDCFLERDLTVLREHTERMSEVTRDLLAFAHESEDSPVPVAMDTVVCRVAKLLDHVYSARNVRLECIESQGVPAVTGSETALETVCMNLLLNALDATPPGGTVSVRTRSTHDGDAVELEVRDTGPGVPPELEHKIFEPFFTTKGTGRGTGLGLAVCRSLVERHGGRIWVDGRNGGGGQFLVSLPTRSTERIWTRHESS